MITKSAINYLYLLMSAEREKWRNDHLPKGYPTQSDIEQLKNVIQDLTDEYHTKIQEGKLNKIWEQLVTNLIKSGRDELRQRTQVAKKGATWFSMENPIVYVVVILVLAAIAYAAYKLGWPLKFGTN